MCASFEDAAELPWWCEEQALNVRVLWQANGPNLSRMRTAAVSSTRRSYLPASHGQSRVSMGLSKSRTKRPADLQSVIGDRKELTTVRRARMPAVIVLRGALLTAYVPNAQMVRAPRSTSHLPRPHPPLSSTSMGERRPTVARQRACSGTGGGIIRYRWSNDNSRQHALPPPAFRHPPGHGVSTRLPPITTRLLAPSSHRHPPPADLVTSCQP